MEEISKSQREISSPCQPARPQISSASVYPSRDCQLYKHPARTQHTDTQSTQSGDAVLANCHFSCSPNQWAGQAWLNGLSSSHPPHVLSTPLLSSLALSDASISPRSTTSRASRGPPQIIYLQLRVFLANTSLFLRHLKNSVDSPSNIDILGASHCGNHLSGSGMIRNAWWVCRGGGGGGGGSGPPHPSLDSLLPGHLSPEID